MRPCSHLPQILALPAWRLQGFAKLPWEVSMSSEDAAKTLGKFLGVPDLQPASVLNLDVQQVRARNHSGDNTDRGGFSRSAEQASGLHFYLACMSLSTWLR